MVVLLTAWEMFTVGVVSEGYWDFWEALVECQGQKKVKWREGCLQLSVY